MIKRYFPALWLTLFAMLAGNALSADETFETLNVGATTYTNVTVLNRTASDVFIKHAGGSINFKVKDLAVEELKKLGYAPPEPAKPSALAAQMEAWTEKMRPRDTNEMARGWSGLYEDKFKATGLTPLTALAGLLAVALVLHIFYCVCMRRICLKRGTEPGGLIWLPVLQFIPLHRAAGISPGLVLLYFVPLIGAFVFIYWCVKMCRVLEKSAWLVVLIFVPILNLCFIPYLAFSGSGEAAVASRMKF
jgi:hypothetical protein